MKQPVFAMVVALYLGACGSGGQTGTGMEDQTDFGMLYSATENYYEWWNKTNYPQKNGNQPPYMRSGEFQGASLIVHNGRKYAAVRIADTTLFPCEGCDEQAWQNHRAAMLDKVESIAKQSKTMSYDVDEERRVVMTIMPSVLYGIFRDDGHWWVYGNPMQCGRDDPDLQALLRKEAKDILSREFKDM